MKAIQPDELGSLIKRLRKDAGLTQFELAKRVGTVQTSIARIESGGQNLTVNHINRFSEALGVNLVTLNKDMQFDLHIVGSLPLSGSITIPADALLTRVLLWASVINRSSTVFYNIDSSKCVARTLKCLSVIGIRSTWLDEHSIRLHPYRYLKFDTRRLDSFDPIDQAFFDVYKNFYSQSGQENALNPDLPDDLLYAIDLVSAALRAPSLVSSTHNTYLTYELRRFYTTCGLQFTEQGVNNWRVLPAPPYDDIIKFKLSADPMLSLFWIVLSLFKDSTLYLDNPPLDLLSNELSILDSLSVKILPCVQSDNHTTYRVSFDSSNLPPELYIETNRANLPSNSLPWLSLVCASFGVPLSINSTSAPLDMHSFSALSSLGLNIHNSTPYHLDISPPHLWYSNTLSITDASSGLLCLCLALGLLDKTTLVNAKSLIDHYPTLLYQLESVNASVAKH